MSDPIETAEERSGGGGDPPTLDHARRSAGGDRHPHLRAGAVGTHAERRGNEAERNAEKAEKGAVSKLLVLKASGGGKSLTLEARVIRTRISAARRSSSPLLSKPRSTNWPSRASRRTG